MKAKGSPKALKILAKLRKTCLSFPDATEKLAWSAPTWRVHDRMFAMFDDHHHDDGRIAVWCNGPLDAQRDAVKGDPDNFFVPPYVGPKGWLGMRLDLGLSWTVVESVLRRAYLGTAKTPARGRRRV
ncbi:MAG: MmcQ/YjbR family DNA-binding protein [Elusimicrobia bacterium]|nr:MmcQ/YjbR family DNA-binding protein [Elusimicrobiota bacterium]